MRECSTKVTDVYGFKTQKTAESMLGRVRSLGFHPSVLFSADWRCRTVVAVEAGKPTIYLKVGGPNTSMIQWSTRPEVFSSSLKRSSEKALVSFLSGNLRAPIRVEYVCNM